MRWAEDQQDEIFRQMTADRKLAVGAMLWRLARALVGDKISYGVNRSARTPHRDRTDS